MKGFRLGDVSAFRLRAWGLGPRIEEMNLPCGSFWVFKGNFGIVYNSGICRLLCAGAGGGGVGKKVKYVLFDAPCPEPSTLILKSTLGL